MLRPVLAPLIMINGCDGYLADFHSAPGPALGARMPDLPRRVGAGADTKNRSRRPRLLLLPGAEKGEHGEGREGWFCSAVGISLGGTRVNVPKKILKPLQLPPLYLLCAC